MLIQNREIHGAVLFGAGFTVGLYLWGFCRTRYGKLLIELKF